MWAQVINTIVGLWLMAAPSALRYADFTAKNNDHIIGPLIATFAIIAYWEATRVVGKWNIALGIWLLAAPWILSYEDTTAIINDMAAGALVVIFAFVKGRIEQQFGGGWSSLIQKNPPHEQAVKERQESD